jgi:hypothetical protein
MTKLLACVFGLSSLLMAASCLDLRDADPCQALAVAACDQSCAAVRGEACVSAYRDACLREEWSADDIDACTEAVKGVDLCQNSVLPAPCQLPGGGGGGGPVGADCTDSGCQPGLTCSVYSSCTKACQSDQDCSGLVSNHGYPAYCSARGACTIGCESDQDCVSHFHCRARSDGVEICDDVYMDPGRGVVPLGDPCGDDLCDPATSDRCVLGYCSKACTSNDDCAALSSLNLSSQCVPLSGKAYCQPSCIAETDCILRSCTETATIDGTLATTCVAERGATLLGGACLRDDDCADALAVCRSDMCVVPCTADEDCPSATVTGEPARCTRYYWDGQFCLAGCNAASARCKPHALCTTISEGNEVCRPL